MDTQILTKQRQLFLFKCIGIFMVFSNLGVGAVGSQTFKADPNFLRFKNIDTYRNFERTILII